MVTVPTCSCGVRAVLMGRAVSRVVHAAMIGTVATVANRAARNERHVMPASGFTRLPRRARRRNCGSLGSGREAGERGCCEDDAHRRDQAEGQDGTGAGDADQRRGDAAEAEADHAE